MIQTLIKNWWLLALCGTVDAIISVIYFLMYNSGPDGPLTFHGWNGTVVFLNTLALAEVFRLTGERGSRSIQ